MVNLTTYRNGVYTGVEDKVLRLQVVENDIAYANKRPSIYVVPGTYVAYEDDNSNDLIRLSMTEVIERVAEVLGKSSGGDAEKGYKFISPEINADTTVLIVPSRWDRRLDERYAPYVDQLAYIPFFLVHHHGLKDKKKLKKRMPPVHALRILHDNAVIKKLSAEQLIYIDGGGDFDALAWGDDGLPVNLKDINLTPLTSASRRRGNKKKSKKKRKKRKKSTRRRKGKKRKSSKRKSSKRKSSKRKKKKKKKRKKKKSTSRRRRNRSNSLKVVAKSLAVTVQALKRMRKRTQKARTSRRRRRR